MQRYEAVTELTELWSELVRTTPPSRRQFHSWVFKFPAEVISEAIAATAIKVERLESQGITMTPEDQGKYCSATCRHIAERESQAVSSVG